MYFQYIVVESVSEIQAYGSKATSVPEPSIVALMGLGLFGLGLVRRRIK